MLTSGKVDLKNESELPSQMNAEAAQKSGLRSTLEPYSSPPCPSPCAAPQHSG